MWKQDHCEQHMDPNSICLSLEHMQKEMNQVVEWTQRTTQGLYAKLETTQRHTETLVGLTLRFAPISPTDLFYSSLLPHRAGWCLRRRGAWWVNPLSRVPSVSHLAPGYWRFRIDETQTLPSESSQFRGGMSGLTGNHRTPGQSTSKVSVGCTGNRGHSGHLPFLTPNELIISGCCDRGGGKNQPFIWLWALMKLVPSKGPRMRTNGTLEQLYLRNKLISKQQIKSVRAWEWGKNREQHCIDIRLRTQCLKDQWEKTRKL